VFYRAASPDGSTEIQLVGFSRFPLQSGSVVRANLVRADSKAIIGEWNENDLNLCFSSAAWDHDSRVVVVMWRNCRHGTKLLAYDVRKGTAVDSAGFIEVLADKIRKEHRLPPNIGDPIGWARTTNF